MCFERGCVGVGRPSKTSSHLSSVTRAYPSTPTSAQRDIIPCRNNCSLFFCSSQLHACRSAKSGSEREWCGGVEWAEARYFFFLSLSTTRYGTNERGRGRLELFERGGVCSRGPRERWMPKFGSTPLCLSMTMMGCKTVAVEGGIMIWVWSRYYLVD